MPDDQRDVYREAFRSIDVPALIADTDFEIRDVNTAGLEFVGYDYDQFVGHPVSIVASNDDLYWEIVERLSRDEAWSGEFELVTKDGETVYGRGSAAPIFVDGEKRGYAAIFIDTTKRRRYRNTSEVLNRLLRHDMRNDMNALYGSLQQARSKTDGAVAEKLDDALDMTSEIINKAERARNLSQLLDQEYDAPNQPVRLDHAINDALVDVIQEYEEAEFHFEDLSETRVVADDLLTKVFKSLLENGVVHNDEETPIVEIEVEDHDSAVVVSVADNGPGVPDVEKDLIFGREEQDPLHHGSGISLFFADNVIDSYGGDLWVEDDGPGGAVFKCRLNTV